MFECKSVILGVLLVITLKDAASQEVDELIPRVSLPQGELEGRLRTTSNNLTYLSFEGIPYAKPPVGNLRFKAPEPAEPWTGVFYSMSPGNICVQRKGGNEDCLFINVYVPTVKKLNIGLPVMVYVHGGGYYYGSSADRDNPELFIQEEVIMVSFNYRLNVFGFLSLDTSDVPGNAGMKDQALALKWVKENIAFFGGNPGGITIFGESAGGASVHLLQISALSREYFNKVISMSGTSLCEFTIQKRPLEVAKRLIDELHLDFDRIDLLEKLQSLKSEEILEAAISLDKMIENKPQEKNFAPVIEKNLSKKTFLSKTPEDYYKNGEFNDVPVIIGYASKEYYVNEDLAKAMIYDPQVIVPEQWLLKNNAIALNATHKKILDFFIDGKPYNHKDVDMLIAAIEMVSDVIFVWPISRTVKVIAKQSQSPVYHYRFSYRSQSITPNDQGIQGGRHADELSYLFPTENVRADEHSSDGWVRRRLIRLFANFAKYGNPTPEPLDVLLPTTWTPVAEDMVNYLEINGENTPSVNPDLRRMLFWEKLEESVRNGDLEISTL